MKHHSAHRVSAIAIAMLLATAPLLAAQAVPKSGPIPRDTARETRLLSGVKAPEGFKVTLFAGPPVAMYPTCLTVAADDAIFLCVDPNLSLDAVKGRGRIMRLVDSNNDGIADTYTTFAEMDSPRGVVHDGKTLYVMHPPNLTAYRDTNGDGVADTTEVLVKGLGFDLAFRGADHTTNGISLGIDGWIYVAVGDYGYQAATGKDGAVIKHHGGSVVRVRTDGTGLEIYATGTRNIYDVAIDPFLNVFSRDNTNDGDGWDTRLHYIANGANMGYPSLYKNFADEHMPSLADYGGGAGTGDVWVHDPGYPGDYGNTLYTGDWTLNRVFLHPMQPKGASFAVQQREFLTIPHPSDMAMDGKSNMFVASLFAGTFTYVGDSVGYVIRVNHAGTTASAAPNYAGASEAQLLDLLVSANSTHRLFAQRELLRRDEQPATVRRLEQLTLDRTRPAYARVAAMFTLRQRTKERARPTLLRAAEDPAIKALALRALVDDKATLRSLSNALFVRGLSDTSAQVRMQSIAGLVRMGAREVVAADGIVQLTGSSDPALAHIAVNAVVQLNAFRNALVGVDKGSAEVRRGSLRALQQMHDTAVARELTLRLASPAPRSDILSALLRLYNREAEWTSGWWGTRPNFVGPYFAPAAWYGSATLKPVLRAALLQADVTGVTGAPRTARITNDVFAVPDSASLAGIIDQYARNRVLPAGAKQLLLALNQVFDPRRLQLVDALLGSAQLPAAATPILIDLDAGGGALRLGVAQLLAGENNVAPELLPIVRTGALNTALNADVRGQLLGLVSRMPGQAGLDVAFELFSQVNPDSGAAAPIDAAWRRFVGDRRRRMELDFFIAKSRTTQPGQRTLAFAVLVQSLRGNGVPQNVRTRVTPVIDSVWADRARATDLVHAIVLMRAEAQYTEKLAAYRGGSPAAAPQGGGGAAGAATSAPPQGRATAADWTQLFNGRDLSDWEIKFTNHPLGENYNNTFRVEDGMLKVAYDKWTAFNGEFGHLFYKQPFSYYIVAVEYRFTGEQVTGAGSGLAWAIRNNGIMAHSQSATSMGEKQDFPISLEVQLLGGLGRGPRTTGNLCTPGTNVVRNDRLVTTHCMNSTSQTYDGDQWVRVEAMVLGDSIVKHIVNGDTVITYAKPQMGGGSANNTNPGVLVPGKLLTEGFIALQAETAPIDFRKVELLNLVGCMDRNAANYKPYYVKSDPAACRPR